ncbi:MAG: hypothetical protein LQ348_006509 [Seirophora lacunosa]|nr:MAG: hypothetical protein LQ344_007229 [Seirophora lacunosa]KAI4173687.1 MAG: hypothetical protein LQ348_006509 [Seirophora lacunosa]
MISQIDQKILPADLESIINPVKFRSLKDLVLDNLSLTGTVNLSFTDIRDAIESVEALRSQCMNWHVQYHLLPVHGLRGQEANGTNVAVGEYEGQLLVQANFSGPPIYFDHGTVSRLILDMLNNYGGIMAYDAVISLGPVPSVKNVIHPCPRPIQFIKYHGRSRDLEGATYALTLVGITTW